MGSAKSGRSVESPGFARYARLVSSRDYLSAERERHLANLISEHGDASAREALIDAHLRLAIKIASKYRNYGYSLETLTSVGNEGLVKATHGFDVSKGFRFATYAQWWIDAEIKDFVVRESSPVKVPRSKETRSAFFKAPRLRRELEAKGMDEDAIIDTMSKRFNLPKDKMSDVLTARSSATSLSAPVSAADDGSATFGDLLVYEGPSPEDIVIEADEQRDNVRRLDAVLSQLGERESDILRSRRLLDEPLTLDQLAARYGVSKERVRQIEVKAMDRVTKALLAA